MIEIEPKPITRSFRLNDKVMTILREIAQKNNRSMSGQLISLIEAEANRQAVAQTAQVVTE
jgi:hypothetical protein